MNKAQFGLVFIAVGIPLIFIFFFGVGTLICDIRYEKCVHGFMYKSVPLQDAKSLCNNR